MTDRTATAYVIVSPVRSSNTMIDGPYKGQKRITGLRVGKVLQNRPPASAIPAGSIVLTLELMIPEDVFYRQDITASVKVPIEQKQATVVSEPVRINATGKALKR